MLNRVNKNSPCWCSFFISYTAIVINISTQWNYSTLIDAVIAADINVAIDIGAPLLLQSTTTVTAATTTYCSCCAAHYCDVIMSAMGSQTTGFSMVYSTVCSGVDQRKHQSSGSLAFVRGIHRSPVNVLKVGEPGLSLPGLSEPSASSNNVD